jgi:hypothetical protein
MLKLCGVPAHPPADGDTVMVPLMGDVPLLVAVNPGMEAAVVGPDPRPIAVLLLVQL